MRKAHVGVEMQYWFGNTIKSAYYDFSAVRIAIRQSWHTFMLLVVCHFHQYSLKKAKQITKTQRENQANRSQIFHRFNVCD